MLPFWISLGAVLGIALVAASQARNARKEIAQMAGLLDEIIQAKGGEHHMHEDEQPPIMPGRALMDPERLNGKWAVVVSSHRDKEDLANIRERASRTDFMLLSEIQIGNGNVPIDAIGDHVLLVSPDGIVEGAGRARDSQEVGRFLAEARLHGYGPAGEFSWD